jgi:hypothetical protein
VQFYTRFINTRLLNKKRFKILRNSLNHDDFVQNRKCVIVLWNNNIFHFYVLFGFSKRLWYKKPHTVSKTSSDCPQRSGEKLLVCYRLATSLETLDFGNVLCFYQYIKFFALIMDSFTIDSRKKIYRLLASCIFTIRSSTNCSKLADVLLTAQGRVINICQDGQILFSHQRNRELNARVNSRGIDYIRANGAHTRN